MKTDFLDKFLIKTEISNLMRVLPKRAQLLHAERWTDREAETNSRFSQFCKSA